MGTIENNDQDTSAGTVGKKKSEANTTNVAAGATLNFGNLKVDGVIGTQGNGSATENGTLRTDNLMSRVSVHYWF